MNNYIKVSNAGGEKNQTDILGFYLLTIIINELRRYMLIRQ